MNKMICLLALAALCATAAPGADLAPLFSPEPPEPAAAALVETYLGLLADGDFQSALALNDLRGMRQYLLERRLADIQTKNPELTASDLDEMSAQVQLHDLNPARLQQILLDVMNEANYPGMTWRIRGFAPAPDGGDGHLAGIEAQTADGRERPILLGLVKLGEQWMVAPAIVEKMMSNRPVVRVGSVMETPPKVAALIHSFWTSFQTGELNESYAGMGAAYRSRVPLLAFLGQAQAFLDKAGIPTGWTLVRSIEAAPDTLFVGVQVAGSRTPQPTLMRFKKMGQTWVAEDIQFEMPRPQVSSPAPGGPEPLSRPDLRPDFTPAIDIE
jgi:hypothetical protein